jgi:AraC-like DNA-binding protein
MTKGMPRAQAISTHIWRADDLGEAELLRGRFADYAYDVHTHDRACFALITGGAIRIKLQSGEFVARAGDLFALDADEPHAGWPVDAEGWRQRTLYADLGAMRGMLDEDSARGGRASALASPIIRDARLAALFRGVHACSENAGPALKRQESYLAFVERLFARHMRSPRPAEPSRREDGAVAAARDFLNEHLDAQVRLSEIAEAAGLPPFRLYRAFERATGMSPHAYQRQARIRLAASLIRRGETLSAAAVTAGFADQAHLTRSFRRTMGVTPGAYRAAWGA